MKDYEVYNDYILIENKSSYDFNSFNISGSMKKEQINLIKFIQVLNEYATLHHHKN